MGGRTTNMRGESHDTDEQVGVRREGGGEEVLEGQSLLGWTTRESAHLKGTPIAFWPGSSPVAALLYSVLFYMSAQLSSRQCFFFFSLSLFMTIDTNTGGKREP